MSLTRRKLARAAELPLKELLSGDVVTATGGLIGCVLSRRVGSEVRRALIVETEAYHQREPGSHSHRGITPRTEVMFGPPGHLYVYFTYGMWYCANVVAEPEGTGAGILLRAAEPLPPYDGSQQGKPRLRLSGPGLLCQGLQITKDDNRRYLLGNPATSKIWLQRPADYVLPELEWSRRVGLGIYEELRWRAHWKGHGAVSKGRPTPPR
jgi:DNA-3-methyladenine glycosylase